MIAIFNNFNIELSREEAISASNYNIYYSDLNPLYDNPLISIQLEKIGDDDILNELLDLRIWKDDELKNEHENRLRILWIAACEIRKTLNCDRGRQ